MSSMLGDIWMSTPLNSRQDKSARCRTLQTNVIEEVRSRQNMYITALYIIDSHLQDILFMK